MFLFPVLFVTATVSRCNTGLILCIGERGVESSTTVTLLYRNNDVLDVFCGVAAFFVVVVGLINMGWSDCGGGAGGCDFCGVDDRFVLLLLVPVLVLVLPIIPPLPVL